MNASVQERGKVQHLALFGAALAVLVLASLGLWWGISRQRNAPSTGDASSPAPARSQTTTDASRLFTIEIPAGWTITKNEGREGIQLSFLSAQSPNFQVTLDATANEPFVPRRYEQGAEFSVHAVRGREDVVTEGGARTAGLLEPSPVTIGGVAGVLRAGVGMSTLEGRNLDAIIHHDGVNYIFSFGYNPATYPEGEMIFREMLSSFQLTSPPTPPPTSPTTTVPPPTVTPSPPPASPSPSPSNTPTASPYVYPRPNVWE